MASIKTVIFSLFLECDNTVGSGCTCCKLFLCREWVYFLLCFFFPTALHFILAGETAGTKAKLDSGLPVSTQPDSYLAFVPLPGDLL